MQSGPAQFTSWYRVSLRAKNYLGDLSLALPRLKTETANHGRAVEKLRASLATGDPRHIVAGLSAYGAVRHETEIALAGVVRDCGSIWDAIEPGQATRFLHDLTVATDGDARDRAYLRLAILPAVSSWTTETAAASARAALEALPETFSRLAVLDLSQAIKGAFRRLVVHSDAGRNILEFLEERTSANAIAQLDTLCSEARTVSEATWRALVDADQLVAAARTAARIASSCDVVFQEG